MRYFFSIKAARKNILYKLVQHIKDVRVLFKIRDYPEFSWSYSRQKTLLDCERKYGYDYYFSHNGWLFDAPSANQHAYRLKKLTSLPVLFDQAVHDVIDNFIEKHLTNGKEVNIQDLENQVRLKLRTGFLESRNCKEFWETKPNHYTMLHEMYYEKKLSNSSINDIHKRLSACLNHFVQSKTFNELLKNKHIRLHPLNKFPSTTLNNVKVYAAMDLIYQDPKNDRWVIIDWKTGKRAGDDVSQLSVYALYATMHLQVPIEKVEVRNEFLTTGACHTYRFTKADMDIIVEQINSGVKQMKSYLSNISLNKPAPLKEFQKSPAYRCGSCNYKELCEQKSTNKDAAFSNLTDMVEQIT